MTLDFNVCLRSVDKHLRFCMFMNIPELLIRELEHCMTKIMTGLGGRGGGRGEEGGRRRRCMVHLNSHFMLLCPPNVTCGAVESYMNW